MISRKSLTQAAVGMVFANAVVAGSASAAPITLTFPNLNGTSSPATQASFSFPSGGITLTVDNATGGPFPTAGGLNSTAPGLCVWGKNGGTQTRCGYTTPNADSSSILEGLNLTFSKPVKLTGFTVGQFVNLSSGSLKFGASPAVTVNANGFYTLADVLVGANTPIFLDSDGTLSGTNDSGIIRISSLQVEEVPGPLPLLGAATAFTLSRRLRKRITSNPHL
jgi:hypothetical protein